MPLLEGNIREQRVKENEGYTMEMVYEAVKVTFWTVTVLLAMMNLHYAVYFLVGLCSTRTFLGTDRKHRYAVLIAARNEEAVIGSLLESIQAQDYPQELVTVFVVADNCTDGTAAEARVHGAVCYERFHSTACTKGYALQFLTEQIERDYGLDAFEGYFVFDADNLLAPDYISRMNEAFDTGESIVTSYRNTKNFDENWVASTYAIHWLRSVRFFHRARSVLRLATNIQGTGFLMARKVIRDGWNYTSLTEDRALTVDAVLKGYSITYQDAAVFYDEQPTSLRIAWRQRIRWSKGHLLAFAENGGRLFVDIFCAKTFRERFMAYDTFAQLFPLPIANACVWLFGSLLLNVCMCGSGSRTITVLLLSLLASRLWAQVKVDLVNILQAVYVFLTERKRIVAIPWHKKVLYCLTWPVFDIFYRYSMIAALFMKVSWKPIPHRSTVRIEDIVRNSQ